MKAAVLEKLNAPLAIRDLDMATHQDNKGRLLVLDYGQVLVRVLVAGICGAQLQEISGVKGDPSYLPHLLGHEGCGIVEETGLGVKHVEKGDKVVMHWRKGIGMDVPGGIYNEPMSRPPAYGSSPLYAWHYEKEIKSGPITTFSEYSIVSENRVTAIPHDVPNDLAALLGCSLSTALALIENEAHLKSTDTVFVIGCGGLGLALILALRIAGIKNILAHDKCARKQRLVNEFGAKFLLNLASGFDLVIDTTGNYEHLASERYISLQKGGSQGGGFQPDKDIPRYIQMWRDGLLEGWEKLITHRVSLEQINDGIELVRQGKAGRVLIDIDKG